MTDIVILVGGRGKRLGKITRKTPKPLIMINKKRFLDILLSKIIFYNFKNIYLLCSYKKNIFFKLYHKKKIHNSQIQGTLDISGYEVDYSGNNGTNASSGRITKTAVVKSAHLPNNDVSLNDLSANTTYDLSVNLIGSVDDLSNAKIIATATTRPANFTATDVSQNNADTSANTLVIKIYGRSKIIFAKFL